MSRSGGKGRISNGLVAASCAAVMTVYAAGYWRTRDEARRMEAQAQERRPATRVAVAPPAPAVAATAPSAAPVAEMPIASTASVTAPVAAESSSPDGSSEAPPKAAASPPESSVPSQGAKAARIAGPAPIAKPAPVAKPPPAPAAPEPAPAAEPALVHSVPLEEPPPPPPSTPPPPGPLPEDAPRWRDGTYTGWGQSNHGDIEAKVVIENGRIISSGIETCATRYPCDVIELILLQPVERQNPEVDRVSRATESADAYYYGLVEALKKALDAPVDAATDAQ